MRVLMGRMTGREYYLEGEPWTDEEGNTLVGVAYIYNKDKVLFNDVWEIVSE